MKTGNSLVIDLEDQMNTIGLPLMALKLDELYRSANFLTMDRLEMLSVLLEYSCAGVPLFRRNGYRQSGGRKPLFRNRDTAHN